MASSRKRQKPLSTEDIRMREEAKIFPQVCSPDLCPQVKTQNKPKGFNIKEPVIIASCHDNAIKNVCLSPGGNLTTSDLGGHVKFWKMKGKEGAIVKADSAFLPKYSEDMAWHPDNKRLFVAFRVERPHAQVYFKSEQMPDFQPLTSSPHTTGVLRCIRFMPWESSNAPCFATGGDDHLAVLWSERGGEWRGEQLHHRHSSAVTGLTGDLARNWLLSSGLDKKLVIHDISQSRNVVEGKHDSPLLSVEANPVDPNLFFVTASATRKQILLHDLRTFDPDKCEHSFGWEAEKASTSRKFHQCWSRDGLYVSTGSSDKLFHVFDIRVNSPRPAVTIRGHNSWVLKAEWHPVITKMVVSTTREGHIWLQDCH